MSAHTFIFADLVGFTAFTELHGDEAAADLAQEFCARVCAMNSDHRAEEVKLLGDGSLIRVEDAAFAADLALHLVERDGLPAGFPQVRAGVHTGPAVRRGDDWFGGTVNVAARLVAEAPIGEALASRAVRDAAGATPGIGFDDHGELRLRGLSRAVETFSLRRLESEDVTHAALAGQMPAPGT